MMSRMNRRISIIVDDFVQQIMAIADAQVLQQMDVALSAVAPAGGGIGTVQTRRKQSPAVSATRRLQGQYLGRLRGLRGAARARVKATARSKGVAAAVALADRLLAR
jgi:hypothetical protein